MAATLRFALLACLLWATGNSAYGQPNGLPPLPRGTATLGNAARFPVWPFPGDANRDASIDQRDLDKVTADLGQVGRLRVPDFFGPVGDGLAFGNLWSDFNGDQVVDALDLQIATDAMMSGTTAGLPIRGSDGAIDFTGSEFGLALCYLVAPIDYGSGWDGTLVPNQPLVPVLLTALGQWSRETGLRTGPSDGYLDGKYVRGSEYLTSSLTAPAPPPPPRIFAPNNDFRVDPNSVGGLAGLSVKCWSTEAHWYFHVAEYRRARFNEHMLDRLALSATDDHALRVEQGALNTLGFDFSHAAHLLPASCDPAGRPGWTRPLPLPRLQVRVCDALDECDNAYWQLDWDDNCNFDVFVRVRLRLSAVEQPGWREIPASHTWFRSVVEEEYASVTAAFGLLNAIPVELKFGVTLVKGCYAGDGWWRFQSSRYERSVAVTDAYNGVRAVAPWYAGLNEYQLPYDAWTRNTLRVMTS